MLTLLLTIWNFLWTILSNQYLQLLLGLISHCYEPLSPLILFVKHSEPFWLTSTILINQSTIALHSQRVIFLKPFLWTIDHWLITYLKSDSSSHIIISSYISWYISLYISPYYPTFAWWPAWWLRAGRSSWWDCDSCGLKYGWWRRLWRCHGEAVHGEALGIDVDHPRDPPNQMHPRSVKMRMSSQDSGSSDLEPGVSSSIQRRSEDRSYEWCNGSLEMTPMINHSHKIMNLLVGSRLHGILQYDWLTIVLGSMFMEYFRPDWSWDITMYQIHDPWTGSSNCCGTIQPLPSLKMIWRFLEIWNHQSDRKIQSFSQLITWCPIFSTGHLVCADHFHAALLSTD